MAVQSPQTQHHELHKLLSGKALRAWTTSDVAICLTQMNDGLFAKYAESFQLKQINGQILMTLDNDKKAIEILGTHHQITTFVQSIKQLKSRNGRKMSNLQKRRQSRRGQSLQSLPFSKPQIDDLMNDSQIITRSNSHRRSKTPSKQHPKSNSFHIAITKSPTCNDITQFSPS